MYGINYSGGANRTHGQIERAERIDSFGAAHLDDLGTLFVEGAGKIVPLECEHIFDAEGREVVEILDLRWPVTLELTRTPSGFGGSCAFWVCPCCGKRVRFLYFNGQGFVCRNCARLNYRSQQRTHDSINYARDGLRLAQERLHWEPPFPVAPIDFPHVVPDKPRYMHLSTYYRYLARYRRYQEKYRRDSMAEMLRLLRR